MRKDRKQQKNEVVIQQKLFTPTGNPTQGQADGIDTGLSVGVELLSRLEQQRALTQNILERIVDYGNLNKAYAQVKSNHGSSGIDGMSIEELQRYLSKHLQELVSRRRPTFVCVFWPFSPPPNTCILPYSRISVETIRSDS